VLFRSNLTTMTKVSTYRDILDNHQRCSKVVPLHCVEGWDVTILWEGVLVRGLIKQAGVDPQANTVIFHAHDGYTTSFPLAYIMNSDIIIAYKMNNVTLPAERGYPFALVGENKWGYKWIQVDPVDREDRTYRRTLSFWRFLWQHLEPSGYSD